ncbi:MAG: metallophosphoesterase [Candidatus Hodarchaeaceae archaeon]|nr:metallophosphoesterase [Candidatus Hodarchaeaceae archaeon]
MKIGLMADTHDRIDAVERAIEFFNKAEVEHVLHAGDLVSPFVAPKFSKLKAKLHYVWGNNEGDKEFITVKFGELGVKPLGNFASLELRGRKIALLHGTHEEIIDALVKSGSYDVIVRGHTHRAGISGQKPLLINPGEVCGYLSGRRTVAMLDPKELRAEIVEL